MTGANLTTKEVARLLRVSEATVKRWADDGALPAEKTVGGHRRFSVQAIAQIRRDRGIGAGSNRLDRGSTGKEVTTKAALSSATFLDIILLGDELEASAVLIDGYLHQHTLAWLFDSTIGEALHELGKLWFAGVVTIADEHRATRVLLNGLQKLRAIIVPTDSTGMKAICCGIEGDLHEVPVHLAEVILESEGWEVINLGPNTPLFTLREFVIGQRPQLVCIAARSLADVDRAAAEYIQLRKVTTRIGAAVVFGGECFSDEILRNRFPAELHASDYKSFVKFVQELATKKS